ncbi:hypothetical protein VTI28DRAFT_9340 [Corynascus sepedonium]
MHKSHFRHLLLFGDYSIEKLPAIKSLIQHGRTNPAAERFLREVTDLIQLEFSRTDQAVHGWTKGLGSLLEMAEAVDSPGGSNLAMSTVLLCAARLGQLIVYADSDPTILGSTASPVDIIGFCGGLLPAAVAMAAQDTSQLFALGREIVSISFRLACEVAQRKRLIDDAPASWGKTYVGIQKDRVQEILDNFHENQGIPNFRRITIGVIAKGWLTLIGPPSSMEMLAAWSPEIQAAASVRTDVDGPMHSCWSPKVNTAAIVGTSTLLQQPLDLTKARMLSPGGSLAQYNHPTLSSLLEEIIDDIAHKPLHITDTIQATVASLNSDTHVKLSVMGPTNHQAATTQTLKGSSIKYELNKPSTETFGSPSANSRSGSGLVAIVGMAGRFPGSDTIEGFWENLLDGKCHIKEIPPSRFDITAYYDPTGTKPNSTTARHGAFLTSPGLFDHRLFNLSPREAAQTDPGHRLLLTTTYEALQSAGYHPTAENRARVATYFGQAADEWREVLNQRGADIYYVPGFSRAFAPSRVHHHFGFGGGSYALDSACATSAAAVAMAAHALVTRECDMALAGGVSVLLSPTTYSGLSRAGMLSTTGGCRTFHDNADGYARGEAAGVVVMKRLEDALEGNDRVLAVVRGAVRAYGVGAPSMTRPFAAAQEAAYGQALRQAGIEPEELAFVEMHGTGTQAGDVEEMKSVIGGLVGKRGRDSTLTVGAVKAAVGHGEGAAGVTSLIKAIMMLRHRQIPPQPGWPFELNKKFPELARSNVRIATRITPLLASSKGNGKIKVAINSFDASGGNVSIALEEAPQPPSKMPDVRSWHVVAVSARTPVSLRQNCERLLDFLERNPETNLADLGYTTTARRMHEQLRRAYVGDSTASIIRQLRNDVEKMADVKLQSKPRVPNRVFLFTGQGSQYAGMGAVLFRTSRQFRYMILSYQDMASVAGLPYFTDMISGEGLEEMSVQSTVKIQLAIVALEIAIAKLMQSWGIIPDVVIGHSLGEYAALCVAGVLSISDTLLLVGKRARLMEKHLVADTYAMLATSTTEESLLEYIEKAGLPSCTIACTNAPSLTVASGPVAEVEKLRSTLESDGQRATQLRVPYGFHSSQVDPVLDEYRHASQGTHFAEPKIPVVSTLTGRVEREASTFSPGYLARQAREKVNFRGAVEASIEEGIVNDHSLWLEMGPDPVCLGLVRRCHNAAPSCLLPSLKQGKDNWATISELLKKAYESGIDINWPEFHKPFASSLTPLDLPTYAFDSRDYWMPYTTDDLSTPVNVANKITPGFPTTTLQEISNERVEGTAKIVTFTSRLSDERLLELVRGHVVGGFEICPLAVFQDIALTAAKYLFNSTHGNAVTIPAMSIRGVQLNQGLVIDPETVAGTLLYITGSYRVADGAVEIEFSSKYEGDVTQHGKCQVAFGVTTAWKSSLSQTLYLVKSRLNSLREQAESGNVRRLFKEATYELFSGVVSYATPYQALREVVLGPEYADAVGTVQLAEEAPTRGVFHVSPYWIDAVTHLAGFVVNCGLRYPEDVACLAVGFDAWHSLRDFKTGETYTVYVCLQDSADGGHEVRGDCYVFSGAELVQATLGIKFLRLKKVALTMVLGGGRVPKAAGHVEAIDSRDQDSQKNDTVSESANLPAGPNLAKDPDHMIRTMLAVIANESGCSPEDLSDENQYADLGVDSVMAINILAQLSKELNLQLPAAFFLENETIGDSKKSLLAHLGGPREEEEVDELPTDTATRPKPPSSVSSTELTHSGDATTNSNSTPSTPPELADDVDIKEAPPVVARLTHYQGPRTPTTPKLFLLPGETGSTFDYIALPPLGANLTVYGVDLPAHPTPPSSPIAEDEGAEGEEVDPRTETCLAAICAEQPSGPYLLAGTGTGAVLAYRVARALLAQQQKQQHQEEKDATWGVVNGLVMLDCPAPPPLTAPLISLSQSLSSAHQHRNRPIKVALQVLAKEQQLGHVGCADGRDSGSWGDLIPGLEVRESDIEQGMFLNFSTIETIGKILQSAVEMAQAC